MTWWEYCDLTVEDAFMQSGIMESHGEFLRVEKQGGIKVSGRKRERGWYMDLFDLYPPGEMMGRWYAVLQAGKKFRAGVVVIGKPDLRGSN